jgi:hypothetical protein
MREGGTPEPLSAFVVATTPPSPFVTSRFFRRRVGLVAVASSFVRRAVAGRVLDRCCRGSWHSFALLARRWAFPSVARVLLPATTSSSARRSAFRNDLGVPEFRNQLSLPVPVLYSLWLRPNTSWLNSSRSRPAFQATSESWGYGIVTCNLFVQWDS